MGKENRKSSWNSINVDGFIWAEGIELEYGATLSKGTQAGLGDAYLKQFRCEIGLDAYSQWIKAVTQYIII